MTQEEMRAELEAAGWQQEVNTLVDRCYWYHDGGNTVAYVSWNDSSINAFHQAQDASTEIAYKHLQRLQLLDKLRGYLEEKLLENFQLEHATPSHAAMRVYAGKQKAYQDILDYITENS